MNLYLNFYEGNFHPLWAIGCHNRIIGKLLFKVWFFENNAFICFLVKKSSLQLTNNFPQKHSVPNKEQICRHRTMAIILLPNQQNL